MRSLSAVGSTIHSMIKLPTNQGIVTMKTSREALWECRQLERVQGSWKEVQWRQRKEQMSRIREQVILRTKNNSGRALDLGPVSSKKTWGRKDAEKVFTIGHERPDQYVTMRATLTTNYKQLLANVLWENMEVDYSSLNKGYAKDMYPFPEEGEELSSLLGYPYKCFLQLPKEYSQIRMAEDDEEKTRFHTEEGVYCFTHMPKELKNSAATLQRMMKKVLVDQRGWNVEIYLEEVVIKSKSGLDLV
ncbi:hypothetical protein Tco_1478771 [Tanacetum coccineum]